VGCSSPFPWQLNPLVDKPLKSVPHGQCVAKPTCTITIPAAEHHRHVFFSRYQIIRLGDRGTWVLATCSELLPDGAICKHCNDLRHAKGPRKKSAACAGQDEDNLIATNRVLLENYDQRPRYKLNCVKKLDHLLSLSRTRARGLELTSLNTTR